MPCHLLWAALGASGLLFAILAQRLAGSLWVLAEVLDDGALLTRGPRQIYVDVTPLRSPSIPQ